MRQKGVRGGDIIEDMITEADNLRATWEGLNPILLAYKMEGWDTQSQQMREPLEDEKGKETGSSLELSGRNLFLPTL